MAEQREPTLDEQIEHVNREVEFLEEHVPGGHDLAMQRAILASLESLRDALARLGERK